MATAGCKVCNDTKAYNDALDDYQQKRVNWNARYAEMARVNPGAPAAQIANSVGPQPTEPQRQPVNDGERMMHLEHRMDAAEAKLAGLSGA